MKCQLMYWSLSIIYVYLHLYNLSIQIFKKKIIVFLIKWEDNVPFIIRILSTCTNYIYSKGFSFQERCQLNVFKAISLSLHHNWTGKAMSFEIKFEFHDNKKVQNFTYCN